MNLFTCTPPTALATPPAHTCAFKFNQTVKLAIQRKQATAPFEDVADFQLQATWTTKKAAVDSTKIIFTPYLQNLVIPPSEPNKSGGNDNTTIGGIPMLNGGNNVTVTAELHNAPSALIESLRALSSESAMIPGVSCLEFFPMDEFGDVGSKDDFFGLPMFNFFISDPGSAGKNAPNICQISFDMPFGWSKDVIKTTPGFSILNL